MPQWRQWFAGSGTLLRVWEMAGQSGELTTLARAAFAQTIVCPPDADQQSLTQVRLHLPGDGKKTANAAWKST